MLWFDKNNNGRYAPIFTRRTTIYIQRIQSIMAAAMGSNGSDVFRRLLLAPGLMQRDSLAVYMT